MPPNQSGEGVHLSEMGAESGVLWRHFLLPSQPCSQKIAPLTTRSKPTKPPTTPPAIVRVWLVNGFEVPGSVDGDEVELSVEEPVVEVEVEVAVSDDIDDVLELNTSLLSAIKLLATVLMTVELDSKMLVNKAVVSTSRART